MLGLTVAVTSHLTLNKREEFCLTDKSMYRQLHTLARDRAGEQRAGQCDET